MLSGLGRVLLEPFMMGEYETVQTIYGQVIQLDISPRGYICFCHTLNLIFTSIIILSILTIHSFPPPFPAIQLILLIPP
jgi:hypothetical protein